MQNEKQLQKKKSYTAPTMEVVELDHQVHLLNESLKFPECDNPPCRFD